MLDKSTSAATDVLFQPLSIGKLELKNRIAMAPMTRNMAPEGIPGEANAEYYRRRAENSVGLIITEGTVVDRPGARNEPHIPLLHGQEALAGWKNVVDAVHGAGGKIAPQIWHTGAARGMSKWQSDDVVESPSGLFAPEKFRGKAMTEEDIADTIAAFAAAAADSKAVGFDTIELHGAHGYLIDSFFWEGSNQRDDKWGGATLAERSRFAVELVKAVRAAVGEDFPIILRISQWKQQDYSVRLALTPDEMESWVAPLADAGVDVFHGSQRRFWEPEFPEIDGEKGLNFAGWLKKLTGKTTISVGSVGLEGDFFGAFKGQGAGAAEIGDLLRRMENDEFDLIAIGRALITDPAWAAKVERGALDELKGYDGSDLFKLV